MRSIKLGLSAGTGKLCIFGHLGLVFIWSCFVSCRLLLLYYVICAPVLTEGTIKLVHRAGPWTGVLWFVYVRHSLTGPKLPTKNWQYKSLGYSTDCCIVSDTLTSSEFWYKELFFSPRKRKTHLEQHFISFSTTATESTLAVVSWT